MFSQQRDNMTGVNDIDILMEFLKMPPGSSDAVFAKFAKIPEAKRLHSGSGSEQFLFIEGKRINRVLLVAHADTWWDARYIQNNSGRNEIKPQEIYQENGKIKNKKGGLGADDRAGCAIIWLLKDLGHSILITDGEECGQKGSRWLIDKNPDIKNIINDKHQFVIELDRKNAKDFKCYSVGTDEFKKYVSDKTGYSKSDSKGRTDICILCDKICGVNLSIGYYGEHTKDEYLMVDEWINTLNKCREWLSEEELPLFRLNKNNA